MSTRLATYAKDLKSALEDRLVPVEGGPLDGQLIMSAGVMQEAIASVIHPPVDEYVAEVRTPATIYIDLLCHICGESSRSTINIESKTLVDDKRRTIAPKIDADAVAHMCGQMPLPVAPYPEGQEAFDWTIPVEQALADDDRLADMLRRVGWIAEPGDVENWTDAERDEAVRYAVASHVWKTEGSPDGDGPTTPSHVDRLIRAEAVLDDEPAEDSVELDPALDPTVCPYPDCEKPVEHRGNHGKPRRSRAKAGDADNADGNETPESDLLPGEAPVDPDWLPEGFDESFGEAAP